VTVLDQLIKDFSRLPGIGNKSAARLVYYLLKADPKLSEKLSENILKLKKCIRPCAVCGNYTENELCGICSDSSRDKSLLCIVEQSQDLAVIESVNEYNGVYHVLGGCISPLDGMGPEQLGIPALLKRLDKESLREIIIATNPTVEGDTTALYLLKVLKEKNIRITRLASGLPVGGDLEYAGKLTLVRSLKGRIEYNL
jgi:recombination protein RecR